jgi:predicted nucleic acid-binding protein
MNAYADTGFICSLMAPDANSDAALKCMVKHALPLSWTWLHDLEFRNAMRLRVFRKELTIAEADFTIGLLLSDLASGVYRREEPLMHLISTEAERLSVGFTTKIGTRSLDILHVATALVLGATGFLTFDKRQAELAKSAGLKVPKLG